MLGRFIFFVNLFLSFMNVLINLGFLVLKIYGFYKLVE